MIKNSIFGLCGAFTMESWVCAVGTTLKKTGAPIRGKCLHCSREYHMYICTYSTARFKLYARDYILASINTFSPSSQPMLASKDSMLASKGNILASKGSMLSSKGNMLSCMISLAIEIDARVRLLARIRDRAVSRCTRARLHALVHYFTRDLN